ncbi:hypothetical protein LUZ60_013201 [Juncus effusus]|nr:hypothetical protein LUZ60_013201 [Juncus effusus]
MLRRLISRQLHLHLRRPLLPPIPHSNFTSIDTLRFCSLRLFSASGRDGSDDPNDPWKISPESDESKPSLFSNISESDEEVKGSDAWGNESTAESKRDVFESLEKEEYNKAGIRGMGGWERGEGFKPWTIGEDEEKESLFDSIEKLEVGLRRTGEERIEEEAKKEEEEELDVEELKRKEKELKKILKGPNRAFGDLMATSGITESMLDSLILLKDVRHIPGLPPLKEIEHRAIAKLNSSSRSSDSPKSEDQSANLHVKRIDEKGRAYATGRRKCSVARVWVWPGEGRFVVNEKEFDVYFPILDQRAELLRPFTVTESLGKWDVKCTVKGGGTSGQVGAIRLGISRALQNFEPAYRPYLKAVGYLTRDARVVERKKPGKAKARKSFQWVKR